MKTLFENIFIFLTITGLMLFVSIGCTNNDAAGDAHAGHNHAEGEHPEETTNFDWCKEHAVPESVCTICNPSLIDDFKESGDWCGGHGIPESQCRLCNPEIIFPQEEIFKERTQKLETTNFDWCKEHAVPESVCTICNPSLIDGFKESGDWCGGHGIPESHCRLCNPEIVFPQEEIIRSLALESSDNDINVSLNFRPNTAVCATDGALVRFKSATTGERAGIISQLVYASKNESIIDAPAEILFDETETYVVTTTVSALVSRWLVSPGDFVEKGQALAAMQSPEITWLRSSLVTAHANYEVERKELKRYEEMLTQELISDSDYDRQAAKTEKARAEYVSAQGLLFSVGLNEEDIEEVIEHGSMSNRFVLRAPSDGMIANRIAQPGELLDPGRAFAMLANPNSMWIEADLTEEQIRNVEIGQALTFGSDGRGLNRVGGEIIWISRFLDPHTRTGTVRAKVIDTEHQLQAGEFGRVKIAQTDQTDVVLVPKDAVQWEGCCNVVFVKETSQIYRPHKVQLLNGDGPFYQVTSGVRAGQEVVVNGAFLLKTELKKSSIGAGCCGVDPVG